MVSLIHVCLPRDRSQSGRLYIADSCGESLFEADCLAKADNGAAIRAGNLKRNPVLPYGDTPTGLYAPSRVVKLPEEIGSRLGPWWMGLDPLSGQAHQAEMNGRTGLGIHAGRGDERLVPTHGCLRLFRSDMEQLYSVCLGYRPHTFIEEVDDVHARPKPVAALMDIIMHSDTSFEFSLSRAERLEL